MVEVKVEPVSRRDPAKGLPGSDVGERRPIPIELSRVRQPNRRIASLSVPPAANQLCAAVWRN